MSNTQMADASTMTCDKAIEQIASWALATLDHKVLESYAKSQGGQALELYAETLYHTYVQVPEQADENLVRLLGFLPSSHGRTEKKVHLSGLRSGLRMALLQLPKTTDKALDEITKAASIKRVETVAV